MSTPHDAGTTVDAVVPVVPAAAGAPGRGAPAAGRGAPAAWRGLGGFVALPPEDFAHDHWGRAPLLTRAHELPPVTHGFGPEAVDELLSSRALRTPVLRMARAGRT
ncbi:MAG TPA: hypothetical protein VFI44_12910, partial [Ornithinibacter sp.]|nr:hypothetical protein [Ornithinibacter sp.]